MSTILRFTPDAPRRFVSIDSDAPTLDSLTEQLECSKVVIYAYAMRAADAEHALEMERREVARLREQLRREREK